jgi:iron complex outermembrane receptor protein
MNSTSQRSHSSPRRHVALRVSPIAAAVSTLLMGTLPAHAQTAAAAGAEQTVVITGIRRGIESSISVKRNADGVMEVISAEDIGKLPDVSIAESLARLPGLAGQMVAGRVQEVQIRGLAGGFAGTLLNGRQQVSTGDNRAVEFDQFPSELIGQVRVYKTPNANVVGGGLSGTIDMITVRPLDFGGRTVALNARMEKNSNGALNANTSVNGNRFSASYIDQFADRTIGVALGVAHLDTPSQELHYKAWGFAGPTRDCVAHPEWGCSNAKGIPAGATFQDGFEITAVSRKQIRDGLMGVFEFKPNKNLHSTVDLYYSKFKKDESMRGLMGSVGDAWGGAQGATFSNVTTQAVSPTTTLVTKANVAGVPNLVSRNDLNTREDELKSAGWNTSYKLGGGWTAVADLSYSNAKRQEAVIETYAGAFNGSAKALTDLIMVIPTSRGFPTVTPNLNYADVANVRLSDPAGWGHDGLWKKPKIDDTIKSLNLVGKKDLTGMFSGIDFGLNYTTRGKSLEMHEVATDLKNGRAPTAVPASLLQAPTSLAFAGVGNVLAFDVMGALNSIYDLKPQAVDQLVNRNYTVDEKIGTAFAQLGIDTTLGGIPVRGNVGLQFIHTEQSSTGISRLSGTDTLVTRGTSYDDTLPSVNLVFELPGSVYARLGVAKTLARGRIDDMKAGANVSIALNGTTGLTTWSGSGGNPELQPWRATSYDLSFEKYFSKHSYVSLAGFYKDLDTYIYTQRLPMDFTGFPNTSNPPRVTPVNPIGIFERPANGNGGKIHGVEVSASLDAGTWSKAMQGFGLAGSLSVLSSDVKPNGPTSNVKLPGFSGTTSSLTAYYEDKGFGARVSQRYRSAFRGEINGLHNARNFEEIMATRHVDMQVSYEFQAGAAKGLSLLLQVNNLNNTPYVTRQGNGFGDVIAPSIYNTYGRQILFGANYKL